MTKKNRRAKTKKTKTKVRIVDGMRLVDAVKMLFDCAGCGGLAVFVDPIETTWLPVMPEWSGMTFDPATSKLCGDLHLNNPEKSLQTISFLRAAAQAAHEAAETLAGIAADIEEATGTVFTEELEEVPATDVN